MHFQWENYRIRWRFFNCHVWLPEGIPKHPRKHCDKAFSGTSWPNVLVVPSRSGMSWEEIYDQVGAAETSEVSCCVKTHPFQALLCAVTGISLKVDLQFQGAHLPHPPVAIRLLSPCIRPIWDKAPRCTCSTTQVQQWTIEPVTFVATPCWWDPPWFHKALPVRRACCSSWWWLPKSSCHVQVQQRIWTCCRLLLEVWHWSCLFSFQLGRDYLPDGISIYLSVCLSIYLSIYIYIYPFSRWSSQWNPHL